MKTDDEKPLQRVVKFNIQLIPEMFCDITICLGFLAMLGFWENKDIYYLFSLYDSFGYVFKQNFFFSNVLPNFMPFFILFWYRRTNYLGVFIRVTAGLFLVFHFTVGIVTYSTNSNPLAQYHPWELTQNLVNPQVVHGRKKLL